MDIDSLIYGNPPKKIIDKIQKDKYGVLKQSMEYGIVEDVLKNHSFPQNSSEETLNELKYLKQITDNATDEDVKFCKIMEDNHYDVLAKFGQKHGLDVDSDEVKSWCNRIDPLVFYLKDKFNRPRPYQLSDKLGIELYPLISTDANTGAYPSGHTMDFLVILYTFGQMNPKLAPVLSKLYDKIKNVRQLSGVHYPSDRKVSEYIFTQLIDKNLI